MQLLFLMDQETDRKNLACLQVKNAPEYFIPVCHSFCITIFIVYYLPVSEWYWIASISLSQLFFKKTKWAWTSVLIGKSKSIGQLKECFLRKSFHL